MHSNYFTPIKTTPHYHRHLFNSDSLHRQGDWLCLNCQNLNYSFRKICNRCKTQSRRQNDQHSVYSYYYINNNYTQNNNNNQTQEISPTIHVQPFSGHDDSRSTHSQNQHQISGEPQTQPYPEDNKENQPQWNAVMETPKKKKSPHSPNTKLDGLPSVSPLLKKYHLKQHHTTLQKLNSNTTPNLFELSDNPKQFDSIKITDFDQLILDLNFNNNNNKNSLQTSPFKDNTEEDQDPQGHKFMKEIEQSISRIII